MRDFLENGRTKLAEHSCDQRRLKVFLMYIRGKLYFSEKNSLILQNVRYFCCREITLLGKALTLSLRTSNLYFVHKIHLKAQNITVLKKKTHRIKLSDFYLTTVLWRVNQGPISSSFPFVKKNPIIV